MGLHKHGRDKRESYAQKKTFLPSGRVNCLALKAATPAPNMLDDGPRRYDDRNGRQFRQRLCRSRADINRDLWFFAGCHLSAIRDARLFWGLDAGRYLRDLPGLVGRRSKGRALGVGEVKFTGRSPADSRESHLSHSFQTYRKPSPDHGPG